MASREEISSTDESLVPQKLLWQLMMGFRGKYATAILCLLIFTGINYVVPIIGSATIDFALTEASDGNFLTRSLIGVMGGEGFVKSNLWVPGLLMVGLTIFAGFFSYGKDRFAAEASDGVARQLKNRIYDHLQRLPVSYHDKAETGDVIQRATSDVETLRLALATQVVAVSQSGLLLITAIPVMCLLDSRMTLVSFALIFPIIAFGFIYIKKVKHLFLEVDKAEGEVTRVVQENLTGVRVVRAFARQEVENEKFAIPNQEYRDKSVRLITLMAWYWSISDVIVLLQYCLVLGFGIHFIIGGSLTVGTLFAFLMFLDMLLWPVRQMGRTLTELGKSVVAITRIGEILSVKQEDPVSDRDLLDQKNAKGQLSVQDLSFAYPGEKNILEDISFEINPGETLAIVGASGSGKTTIMSLLLRLYDYEEGTIHLDGKELRDQDRRWVRSQFSIVMQEPFLYSKTIGDNIRISESSAGDDDVIGAAHLADIHDTISTFSSDYRTLVGEKGVTLSGGQRQRVALARALLQKTPLLLLDDALSAVDAETEAKILEALRSRHGKRTTLVIAHRLSTLAHADQIIVLDKGRIVERGTHKELLQEKGHYQRIWVMQNELETHE